LAVAAFEHSLSIDPMQTESWYSLGMILEDIEPNATATFYHKMLISASNYRKMDAKSLRELLLVALRALVGLNIYSNGEISIIPQPKDYEDLNINIHDLGYGQTEIFEGEVHPDNLQSFYPLAELFMGKRRNELPRKITSFVSTKKKSDKKKKRKKK